MAKTSAPKEPKGKSPIKDNRSKQKAPPFQLGVPNKLPAGESGSYAELRIALDSFQAMALVYYGAGKSAKERKNRAAKIKKVVNDALKEWKQPAPQQLALKQATPTLHAALMMIGGYGNGCGPGYCDCNGFCIPQGQPCY